MSQREERPIIKQRGIRLRSLVIETRSGLGKIFPMVKSGGRGSISRDLGGREQPRKCWVASQVPFGGDVSHRRWI